MAKSFEGLSRTDPRGLEPAGRGISREPLLTTGEGGPPPAGPWMLEGPCWALLAISVATLGVTLDLFHSQEVAGVGVGAHDVLSRAVLQSG